MNACSLTFTIFCEDSLYKGVFEYQEDQCYQIAKVIFGKEPKDIGVYHYLSSTFDTLSFYSFDKETLLFSKRVNPKRKQSR